ncbi:hypothetical protein D0Y65_053863 [Glycine soja]|uniref:Secreted protein n=1 Tax=Glycine soja TaxID=3848 RepID=A0A445F419_GLYSO|nr:hypothetical protein D0Y65_053863 [Glycine soja]
MRSILSLCLSSTWSNGLLSAIPSMVTCSRLDSSFTTKTNNPQQQIKFKFMIMLSFQCGQFVSISCSK